MTPLWSLVAAATAHFHNSASSYPEISPYANFGERLARARLGSPRFRVSSPPDVATVARHDGMDREILETNQKVLPCDAPTESEMRYFFFGKDSVGLVYFSFLMFTRQHVLHERCALITTRYLLVTRYLFVAR